MTDHVVYRAFAASGALLYVGYSSRLLVRLHEHSKTAPWWGLAAEVTHQAFSAEAEARAAELTAIAVEQPLFNIIGSGKRDSMPNIRQHADARTSTPRRLRSADARRLPVSVFPGKCVGFARKKHTVLRVMDGRAHFECGAEAAEIECSDKQYSTCQECITAWRLRYDDELTAKAVESA